MSRSNRTEEQDLIQATCHCGAISIEVDAAPESLTDCNCSICRRTGGLWAYYPRDRVRVEAAPDAIVAYVWGDRMLELYRCRTCGCVTHWEAVEKTADGRMGVNARMMPPDTVAGVKVRKLDGADTWKYFDE
jgi:hypothetical protein